MQVQPGTPSEPLRYTGTENMDVTLPDGGLIPMVEGRLGAGREAYGTRTPPELREKENTPLRGEPLAPFKRFFTDTATFGSAAAVECALNFFGPERLLFATDMPFGPEQGAMHIRSALAAVNGLAVCPTVRDGILHTNAGGILCL